MVTVGDELLIGRTVDTNAAWIGAALAELGVPVRERATVADADEAIREAVGRAAERTQVVVVTGGLGPTEDDRTRPAVAALLGAPLEPDPALLARLERRFRDAGFEAMPPANRSQALVPRGGRVLPNPAGTAPGLALDSPGGALILLLPGPPRELRAVFPAAADEIRARLGGRLRPVRVRTLHTTGIAESVLAPRVEEALGTDREVDVAFLPDLVGVDVRLIVTDRDDVDAEGRLDRAEAALDAVIGRYRFRTTGSGDLVEALAERLRARRWTLATGESCTGGLVAKRLTDVPGASTWFLGGVVAYADAAKVALLDVPTADLDGEGAVSEPVARALAEGARRALAADCGIGVTGIAGPGGGTDAKPVGTVWYAAATPDGVEARRVHVHGDREAVRVRSAQAALALLYRMLEEPGS